MANKPVTSPSITPIRLGFATTTVTLPLDQVMLVKLIKPTVRTTEKFKQIMASIKAVGIIEPPVVTINKDRPGHYILLDGHLRLAALRELEQTHVTCLVAADDEAYTYNKHLSRLSIVQEHKMIAQAVKRGVSEAKIAKALNVNVRRIVQKRNLVEGICTEAIELLKDKIVPENVFGLLRKLKAMRQIEVATLMNDAGTYSLTYAKALLAATPQVQLLNPEKPKQVNGLTPEQMARMESEMASLQGEYQVIEDSYGPDVMNLTLVRGYLGSLLANGKVTKFLRLKNPEILNQFEKIADMTSLSGKEVAPM
jgi:RepB plasmid partitioning protein/ParB-like nuclease domain